MSMVAASRIVREEFVDLSFDEQSCGRAPSSKHPGRRGYPPDQRTPSHSRRVQVRLLGPNQKRPGRLAEHVTERLLNDLGRRFRSEEAVRIWELTRPILSRLFDLDPLLTRIMSPSEIATRARQRRTAANDPSGLPIPGLRLSMQDPVRAMAITDKRVSELTVAERRYLYRVIHHLDKIEAEVKKNGPKPDPATSIRMPPHPDHDPDESKFIANLEAEGVRAGELAQRIARRRWQQRDTVFLAAVSKVFLRTKRRQDRLNALRPLFAKGLTPWQAAARTDIDPGFCSRAWHIFRTEFAAVREFIACQSLHQHGLPPIDPTSIKPIPNEFAEPDTRTHQTTGDYDVRHDTE